MSRYELLRFLRNNSGTFLSAEQISKALNINIQSTYSLLRRNKDFLSSQELKGTNGTMTILYTVKEKKPHLEAVLKEYEVLRNDNRFKFMNADQVLQLLLISKINEFLEHERV